MHRFSEEADKTLRVAEDLKAGTVLTLDTVAIRRPGTGLPPAAREQVLGRRLKVAAPAGTLLSWDMLE